MLRLTLWVFALPRRSARRRRTLCCYRGAACPFCRLNNEAQTHPNGAPPPSERVHLDSNLRRWFARNLGLWRSRRQYLFNNEEVFFLDMMIRVEIFSEFQFGEPRYRFSWWPERDTDFFDQKPRYEKAGVMEATLMGHQLQRNRAYLEPTPIALEFVRWMSMKWCLNPLRRLGCAGVHPG